MEYARRTGNVLEKTIVRAPAGSLLNLERWHSGVFRCSITPLVPVEEYKRTRIRRSLTQLTDDTPECRDARRRAPVVTTEFVVNPAEFATHTGA